MWSMDTGPWATRHAYTSRSPSAQLVLVLPEQYYTRQTSAVLSGVCFGSRCLPAGKLFTGCERSSWWSVYAAALPSCDRFNILLLFICTFFLFIFICISISLLIFLIVCLSTADLVCRMSYWLIAVVSLLYRLFSLIYGSVDNVKPVIFRINDFFLFVPLLVQTFKRLIPDEVGV